MNYKGIGGAKVYGNILSKEVEESHFVEVEINKVPMAANLSEIIGINKANTLPLFKFKRNFSASLAGKTPGSTIFGTVLNNPDKTSAIQSC